MRVFYDKLEDQNLHLAAQLARQKEDLNNFYSKISAQNDQLRNLLNDLDPAKLAALEKREARLERDGMQGAGVGAAGDGPTIVNATVNMASVGGKKRFVGQWIRVMFVI